MFNSRHYIPILKWKRAEQGALNALSAENKKHMTPLIQFVMPSTDPLKKADPVTKKREKKTTEERIVESVAKLETKIPLLSKEVLRFWGDTDIFFDVSLLYTDSKLKTFTTLLEEGSKAGLNLIPVVNLSDDDAFKKSVKGYKKGFCLRIVCADLDDIPTLSTKIGDLLLLTGFSKKDVDLIIDIKEINENESKFSKYIKISQTIPGLNEWRTFIFASGGFLENLGDCKYDEETIVPRYDWNGWKKEMNEKKLTREPSFSDYTIQYPIYNESLQVFHPTTSIKYTLEDNWCILKGRKKQYNLYLTNAKLLSGDDEKFYGEDFSYGDKYIAEKGKHYDKYIVDPSIKGTGSTETWLLAGINHHMACTVKQVANLP